MKYFISIFLSLVFFFITPVKAAVFELDTSSADAYTLLSDWSVGTFNPNLGVNGGTVTGILGGNLNYTNMNNTQFGINASGVGLWSGANVKYSGTPSQSVIATFIGSEAGFDNQLYDFNVGGSQIFSNKIDKSGDQQEISPPDQFPLPFGDGFLDFGFYVASTGEWVINGSNQKDEVDSPNFLVSNVFYYQGWEHVVVFLNDSGKSADRDADDMIVLLSVDVPTPSAIALLLVAIFSLFRLRVRKTTLR
ncbi:hypothetical protein ACFSJ3_11675 [Corallincola platygyrae]|uniref:PEP-CTERM sorting domain-containing protein n=1 Tax=Corallincola platygyrae TaxID=1193278 RepID=A0ABW4XM23_9GAMM